MTNFLLIAIIALYKSINYVVINHLFAQHRKGDYKNPGGNLIFEGNNLTCNYEYTI